MITIKRIAWTSVAEHRRLVIDKEYVEQFNKYAQERCKETLPPITDLDIKNAVEHNDDANLFLDTEYTWGYPWSDSDNGHTWKQTLADFIRDIINEDLWDAEYDTEYLETEDWEDSVEGSVEECPE
jgi:hypothetical protein